MNSKDLNRRQIDTIKAKLDSTTGYLSRLKARMERTQFDPADKLYRDVAAAQEAMTALRMTLHYLGCDKGTAGE